MGEVVSNMSSSRDRRASDGSGPNKLDLSLVSRAHMFTPTQVKLIAMLTRHLLDSLMPPPSPCVFHTRGKQLKRNLRLHSEPRIEGATACASITNLKIPKNGGTVPGPVSTTCVPIGYALAG